MLNKIYMKNKDFVGSARLCIGSARLALHVGSARLRIGFLDTNILVSAHVRGLEQHIKGPEQCATPTLRSSHSGGI